jgi:hypothetical protein
MDENKVLPKQLQIYKQNLQFILTLDLEFLPILKLQSKLNNSEKYTLIMKVVDDTFEVDHLHEYTLSMQISSTFFRFCVVDGTKNRCLMMEDFQFEKNLPPTQIVEQLEAIFDENAVLKAGFWQKIKLSVKNIKFSLIPTALFSEENAKKLLDLNCDFKEDEDVFFYKHRANDTVNIFAAERIIISWFKKMYPNKQIDIIHHTSLLIEGILKDQNKVENRCLYVSVENGIVTALLKKGQTLEFCNNFHFKTPNDLVYFILFIYQELDLNPEQIPIVLMGDITQQSESFTKLYKYIRHIHFGERPNNLRFGYKFDEVNDHSYYDLFQSHLC